MTSPATFSGQLLQKKSKMQSINGFGSNFSRMVQPQSQDHKILQPYPGQWASQVRWTLDMTLIAASSQLQNAIEYGKKVRKTI